MPDLNDPIPPTVVKSGSKRPQKPPQRRVAGKFAREHPPINCATPPPPPQPAADDPGRDRIEGAAAIALFLYGSADEKAQKRLYHAVGAKRKKEGRKRPPVGKEAGKLVASRTKLRAYWDELSSDEIED